MRAIPSTGLDLLELGQASPALESELAKFDSIVSWYGSSRLEFREAVAASGLPRPGRIGIFGKVVDPGTRLADGDRVEIYRPLALDPKEARRRRARKSR